MLKYILKGLIKEKLVKEIRILLRGEGK